MELQNSLDSRITPKVAFYFLYRGFFNANINGKYDSFERIKKGLHHGSLQLSGSAIDPLANFTL